MARFKLDHLTVRVREALGRGPDSSDTSSHQSHAPERPSNSLERELRSWQIYMIPISGFIGGTILSTNGEYLRTAGPAGLLTTIGCVGAIAICVLEGLSEMVVLWPVSNAMVEYAQSSVVAYAFIAASKFAGYWNLAEIWQIIVFYIICPCVVIAINWLGVKWYGWVEGIGGCLKLLWVLGSAFFLIGVGAKYGSTNINDGYENDATVAKNQASAVFLIIPFLTHGVLGIEFVAVTAFEAKSPRKSLRGPSRYIAYIMFFLFLLCGISETINITWDAKGLPEMSNSRLKSRTDDTATLKHTPSILVLSAEQAMDYRLAGFFTGCLIYSDLSAANTALYVASRTLYGLCRELSEDDERLLYRLAAKLGTLDRRTRVPLWSIVVSVLVFCWIPFLHVAKTDSTDELITILITIGSIAVVLVWGSQCLAYIRYHRWCGVHKKTIKDLRQINSRWARYDRWDMEKHTKHYFSIWGPTQPFPAYLGLLGCFLITFVFSTATWWDHTITARKVIAAFLGPVILLLLWVSLKLWHNPRQWWNKLDKNPRTFQTVINNLERLTYLRDEDETDLGFVHRHDDPEDAAPAASSDAGAPDVVAQSMSMHGIGAHVQAPQNGELDQKNGVDGSSFSV